VWPAALLVALPNQLGFIVVQNGEGRTMPEGQRTGNDFTMREKSTKVIEVFVIAETCS
jgi:hypothetical protein